MSKTGDKKKRPYRPPTLKTEKLFERRSLACGKANRNTSACIANLRNS